MKIRENMRYYTMEPLGESLPPANKQIVLISESNRFSELDYDTKNDLISDRLKDLMELYIPKYDFYPVVYVDEKSREQLVFWKFKPSIHINCQANYRSDGVVSSIDFSNDNFPVSFTTISPKGICSIVVRISVAESALRRGILGLNFTKVLEYDN